MARPDWASEDGTVQLYCGDCLDVLPHLAGVDAVVTDPPYGVGYKYAAQYLWFRAMESIPWCWWSSCRFMPSRAPS